MKKVFFLIITAFLLIAVTEAQVPQKNKASNSQKLYEAETADLVAFVRKAADLIRMEGETAFNDFNQTGSPWRHEETYIFVLDPEGNPGHALGREMAQVLLGRGARVDLHGHFIERLDVDQGVQALHQLRELGVVQVGGGAAAEVNLVELRLQAVALEEPAQQVDLAQQVVQEELDLGPVIGDDDVADAVPAELGAERNVQVNMQRAVFILTREEGL